MFPDLTEATKAYWRKLDELEAAYQRNEMSLAEVDARVAELMTELGQARRKALRAFWANLRHTVAPQWETIAGVALIGVLAYIWFVVELA
ncbi:MAG: hypothetical protein HC925_02995 [Coleofasciculaceae cyanobacterium SM2_3_26]|nr:hypothetical protein [Coleofasciculaceae cyanobacterium SM2_3_26]